MLSKPSPMETIKLATVSDLLAHPEERVALIDGEIVRRPMARGEHAMTRGNVLGELQTLRRPASPGGWWIATEISVAHETHQCLSHDLAGRRRSRMPEQLRASSSLPANAVSRCFGGRRPARSASPAR
ncbi:hypothetical protein [uncultured Thiohalocapsa sp.]|uniref:hypothetical protein n=1 Tax=uncultured Thiohalocapsa sp. TaxID=768990 RepID=UPI0025F41E6F|nr:hypothetical protein [uncultured Thiohalocapsa sp.]